MPAHTYVPGLRLVTNTAYRYGARYQSKLNTQLTSEQLTCFNAALSALQALVICLGANPKQPNSP